MEDTDVPVYSNNNGESWSFSLIFRGRPPETPLLSGGLPGAPTGEALLWYFVEFGHLLYKSTSLLSYYIVYGTNGITVEEDLGNEVLKTLVFRYDRYSDRVLGLDL